MGCRPLGRPNRIVVDLAAVRANVRALRNHVGRSTRIFAPLKANAYGFGLVPVARVLETEDVDGLAVVDAADAAALRRAGITKPVLLYGGNLADAHLLEAVVEHRLIATIHDMSSAEVFMRTRAPIDAFVKINVGNQRFGLVPEDMGRLAAALQRTPLCHVVGVYAHPDVPDDARESDYLRWQIDRLQAAAHRLQACGIETPLRMAASSRVLLARSDLTLNAIDPGHLLYGLDPGGDHAIDIPQRLALASLETSVVHVCEVVDGPYRNNGPGPEPISRLAVLPLGFADGARRCTAGSVLIRGKRLAVLPRVSAEHMRVDVSAAPDVCVGDTAVIVGPQGSEEISLLQVARHQGVRPLEITAQFPAGMPRTYVDGTEQLNERQYVGDRSG